MNDVLYVTRGLLPVVLGNTLLPFEEVIDLLEGETDGLAIDFTDTANYILSTWDQEWNQVRTTSVDVFSSPHVFYTQSGTSPKYVTTSATGIGWSPHNLCLQSQDMATSWTNTNSTETTDTTVAPDGDMTADTVTASSDGTSRGVQSAAMTTLISTVIYTVSGYFKPTATTTWVFLGITDKTTHAAGNYFDLSGAGAVGSASVAGSDTVVGRSITAVDNGFYRCSVAVTSTGTTKYAEFVLADADNDQIVTAGDTIIAWGLQVNRGYLPTAYIATTTAAIIGLPISYGEGLLVEPAATNILVRSENIATTWVNQSSTETVNTDDAPDGSATADTLTASAANAAHNLYQNNSTIATATTKTFSAYAKAGTHSYVQLICSNFADDENHFSAVFDLSNAGATAASQTDVGTTSGTITSTSQTAVGNGWYRITMTGQNAGAETYHLIGFAAAASGNTFSTFGELLWTAAGTETLKIWGLQCELGTVASSYVPTVAASVARAADNISTTTSISSYASFTTQTLLIWYKSNIAVQAGNGTIGLLSVADGTSNFYEIRADNNTVADGGEFFVQRSGVAQADIFDGTAFGLNTRKFGASAKINDFVLYRDGVSIGTPVVSGNIPITTPVTIYVGTSAASSQPANGKIERVILLPREMSDAELAVATT